MIAGRLEAAEAFARRGLELSRESKDRGSQAWLLGILGDLDSRRKSIECGIGQDQLRQCARSSPGTRDASFASTLPFRAWRVSAQVDDCSKARAELLAAAELYRVMSMPFWLSQAEAALGELS